MIARLAWIIALVMILAIGWILVGVQPAYPGIPTAPWVPDRGSVAWMGHPHVTGP